MTAHRNARGQFVSADVAAAERVLEAAVREGIRILRRPLHSEQTHRRLIEAARIALVQQTLYHAAHAAEPLLRSAS